MTGRPDLLALWCVPRSRSTAFERAMHERGDLLVVHEPFSRVCDFGVAEVADRTCRSQEEVMAALVDLTTERPVLFKDTTDFHFDRLAAAPEFVKRCRHAAMVRNPQETVRSHLTMQPDATSSAMGFRNLWDIVSTVTSAGLPIHIVDGDKLVVDAEEEMRKYCEAMGIPFIADSLTFRKESPSSWGATRRWHAAASESSALGVVPTAQNRLPADLEPTVAAFTRDQQPYYELILGTRG